MMWIGMSILANVVSALMSETRWMAYTKLGHRRLLERRRAMDRWILFQTTLASFGILCGAVALLFVDSSRSIDGFIWASSASLMVQVLLHIQGPKEK